VAARLFGATGYRGTSLADVAQAAGLSNAGLLHHFPSKQQLLIEVLRRRDEVDRAAFRFAQANDTGDETVWDQLDSLVELARTNSERPGLVKLYTTVSGEATDADNPAHGWLREHLKTAIDELYDAFETGKALGIVRPEAPSASLARSTIALLDGLQIQWLAARGHQDGTPVDQLDGTFDAPSAAQTIDINEMSRDVKVFVDGLRALWQLPGGG
jgi:AcrR family transcriptional regulator